MFWYARVSELDAIPENPRVLCDRVFPAAPVAYAFEPRSGLESYRNNRVSENS